MHNAVRFIIGIAEEEEEEEGEDSLSQQKGVGEKIKEDL
jgi:hypothetical protein